MSTRRAQGATLLVALTMVTASLAACGPVEYHGADADIDGVLWRQIAAFEDPVDFRSSPTQDPPVYVTDLGIDVWDGSVAAIPDLSEGAILLYDVVTTESVADVGVFISSGPRPDVPTDAGDPYTGPSQVYTCYGITADLHLLEPSVTRTTFTECPSDLIAQLPGDAAFASAEVFDG